MSGCKWPLNTAQLSQVEPYKEFWFDAKTLNPGAIETATFESLRIASRQMTLATYRFDPGVENDVYWSIGIKGGYIDWTLDGLVPRIKIKPIWLQADTTPAPSPTEHVKWQIAISQSKLDGTLNFANNLRGEWLSPVLDHWRISSGDDTDQERAFKVTQYNGTASPIALDTNYLVFQLERQGSHVDDDFLQPAHLLGVMVQFETDFANQISWPTP